MTREMKSKRNNHKKCPRTDSTQRSEETTDSKGSRKADLLLEGRTNIFEDSRTLENSCF